MCEHWGSQGHSSTQLQDLQDAQHASDRAIAPAPEVVSDPCISSWTSSPFPSVSESGTGVLCSTPSSGCLCSLIQQGVGRCMVPLGPTEEVLTLGHSDICGLEQEEPQDFGGTSHAPFGGRTRKAWRHCLRPVASVKGQASGRSKKQGGL